MAARVLYGLSSMGWLPTAIGKVYHRTRTPLIATAIVAAAILAFALFLPLVTLAELTSLITLLPLAVIVAYFMSHGIWRRVAIVASVVPLALAANILRVVATVKLVSIWGVEAAQGSLHESFGLATSILGTLAVVAVARRLR